VIVIGNIAVGGAGKTPITLWLAEKLKSSGRSPAIISRGYGGRESSSTILVTGDSDPELVGDEPVLLARRSGCPVFVDPNRVRAAASAVHAGADLILSDDGLQHYRLRRNIEIAIVDGDRGFGNGHLLPAGPLREPVSRLGTVDHVLVQNGNDEFRDVPDTINFTLAGDQLRRVSDDSTRRVSEYAGKSVHAVAAIANPSRFFDYLEQHGINVLRHPLPDHASLSAENVTFSDDLDVIVTEKDAVKCREFAHERLWYLPVDVVFESGQEAEWLDTLHAKLQASDTQVAS
jgi:tetraacyldisaccharide 4'-kinase